MTAFAHVVKVRPKTIWVRYNNEENTQPPRSVHHNSAEVCPTPQTQPPNEDVWEEETVESRGSIDINVSSFQGAGNDAIKLMMKGVINAHKETVQELCSAKNEIFRLKQQLAGERTRDTRASGDSKKSEAGFKFGDYVRQIDTLHSGYVTYVTKCFVTFKCHITNRTIRKANHNVVREHAPAGSKQKRAPH